MAYSIFHGRLDFPQTELSSAQWNLFDSQRSFASTINILYGLGHLKGVLLALASNISSDTNLLGD